ncbi:preprotein translocase subunit SecG [Blochmannia endosymbiont of Colobopsis nipponica]|uniref:preprotein translocase subunit SecG n=1 Tax=Blochmannia endosymbiont of Colobopsis nipponica TaxID=2681987 RepID=UPI0017834443|nr:preprotein translocase subunit SecG [Blochmannia endosymbiont of Colobopsis nipponica]QOI10757.1 preprotein translocase subunit SecG [Blochmannia endosymbiont of Colobopsis nipponica]
MYLVLLLFFLFIAVILISLIMLQYNQNVNMSANFTTEHSLILFNPSNSNSYLSRIIIFLAFLFFVLSLILGNISNKSNQVCIEKEDCKKQNQLSENSSIQDNIDLHIQ